jgi:hypothetical protein
MKAAFDITFVDVRLPNKQKRQHLVLRADNQKQARELFGSQKGSDFKALSVDEVLATVSPASLEMLTTRFKDHRIAA